MQESVKGSEKAGFGQLFLFQNLNLKKSTGLPPRSSAPQRFKALPQHHLTPPLSSPAPHHPDPPLSSPSPHRPDPPLSAPAFHRSAMGPAHNCTKTPLSAQRFNASAAPASSASHSSTTPPSALRFITPPRHFRFVCFPKSSASFPASKPVQIQLITEDQYDSERSPFHEHRSVPSSVLLSASGHSTSFTVIHITISSSHCPQTLPQHDTCPFEAT